MFQGLFYMRCWNKFSMTNVARLFAKLSQLDRPNRLPCCPCQETALLFMCKAESLWLVQAKKDLVLWEQGLFTLFFMPWTHPYRYHKYTPYRHPEHTPYRHPELVSGSFLYEMLKQVQHDKHWYIKHYRLSIGDNNQYKKHTQTLLSPAFFFCITIHKNFCMIFTQQKTSLSFNNEV